MNHRDIHDFQLSVKVPRSSRLEWGDEVVQNTTRYYVSTSGKGLAKVMPPLAKQFRGDKALISRQEYDLLHAAAVKDVMKGMTNWNSVNISEWDKWKDRMERRIGVQKGWTVTITNDISHFKWGDVNWLFYIEEAKKLIVT